MAQTKKSKAVGRLRKVIDKVSELKELPRFSPEFKKWHRDARVVIANTFGNEASHVVDFDKIHYSLVAFAIGTPGSKFQAAYEGGLESAKAILESMIDEINEYWEDESVALRPSDSNN